MVLLQIPLPQVGWPWAPGKKTEPRCYWTKVLILQQRAVVIRFMREIILLHYTLQDDLRRAEAQLKDMPKNDKQRRAAQEKKIAGLREELSRPVSSPDTWTWKILGK